MNVTLSAGFSRPSIQLPSQSIVDANLAVSVVFTTVSSILNGLLILVVLFSKQLRSQPYQCFLSNYLLSTIALMLGFGVYRIFQIQNYRYDGFMESAEKTNCGFAKFLEFPLLTSNFCLFVLGCERYIYLKHNRVINCSVLCLFLVLPWALGVYRYIFELFSSKEQYLNIPYAGLCIDIANEKESRRNLYIILNVTVPLSLAFLSIILAYWKVFSAYKNVTVYLRRRSYSDINEEAFLLQRKQLIRKVVLKSVNLAAILLGIHAVITAITSSLFSQLSGNKLSQDIKDRVGTVGVAILYLETVIIPIVYLIYNRILLKALINTIFKMIPQYKREIVSA